MGIFTDVLLSKPADIESNSKEGIEWFKKTLQKMSRSKLKNINLLRAETETDNVRDDIIGHMYMFVYDALYKDVLPYYDRFPLVIPMDFTNNGFIGLNLHYIAPKYRAILLEELFTLISDEELDSETRFKLSYGLISKVSRFKYGKPCVKRYLTSHIEGQLERVLPIHWSLVSQLPSARFGKGTNTLTVYKDSRKQF
jgi:hypothetical protein